MSQLGDCQTDNQGNPLPNVGGTCNLAGLHLDASVIDTPDPSQIYGNGLVNNGMLDWEFYGVDARPSAGANPASQNDFYGNLYSLASFYGSGNGPLGYNNNQATVKAIPVPTQVDKPCGCSEGSSQHSKKQLYIFIALIVGAYILANR